MNQANFHIGELRATIGNNAAHQEHRAGYNGLWSLTYGSSKRNLLRWKSSVASRPLGIVILGMVWPQSTLVRTGTRRLALTFSQHNGVG